MGPSGVLAGATVTRDRACACRRSGCAPARGARAARRPFCGLTHLADSGWAPAGGGRGGPRRSGSDEPPSSWARPNGRSGRRRRPGACGARGQPASNDPDRRIPRPTVVADEDRGSPGRRQQRPQGLSARAGSCRRVAGSWGRPPGTNARPAPRNECPAVPPGNTFRTSPLRCIGQIAMGCRLGIGPRGFIVKPFPGGTSAPRSGPRAGGAPVRPQGWRRAAGCPGARFSEPSQRGLLHWFHDRRPSRS